MFKIFAVVMLVLITIACPPLAILTAPALVIWFTRSAEKQAETARVIGVYETHKAEQDRLKFLSKF